MLLQNHYPRFRGAPFGHFRTLTRRPPSVDSGLETHDEEADGRIAEQEARIAAETRAEAEREARMTAEARIQELGNVRTTAA